jgi:8-oxo-dGTP pyrophosphatase MutT (NUDIX family)
MTQTLSSARLIKVAAFITQDAEDARYLLVFRHPTAGLQIPAGSAELNETAQDAVLREAVEESGLTELRMQAVLGSKPLTLDASTAYLLEDTLLQLLPDDSATVVRGHVLRRGSSVRVSEQQGIFSRVSVEEGELRGDEWVITSRRSGWVVTAALTRTVERHSFHLMTDEKTPSEWLVEAEPKRKLVVTCFWQRLEREMPLFPPQNEWLREHYARLRR